MFSAGIGENAPEIRSRVCDGLRFLGIELDARRNAANAAIISADGTPVTVRIIRTEEEALIVKEVRSKLSLPTGVPTGAIP